MTHEAELRQRLTLGLARRYSLRARAEGAEFIIEGIDDPGRLPNCQPEVHCPGVVASGQISAAAVDAAVHHVIARVQVELKAIEQAGVAAYLLLVADVARYGRSIGAVSLAIGLSPGSLVNYLLEISTVDPICHGLHFERFWNPELSRPPAIYLELAGDHLDGVIEYARNRCASNPVAQIVTDFNSDLADDLPTLGLIGLKALTVLRRTCERVRETKGVEVPIDQVPLDDAKTYDLLKSGDTGGVFQLESDGMRDLCRKFQPANIAHIGALITVHRVAPFWPGPPGFVADFISCRRGWMSVKYVHRSLEPVLRETYGVLIYQEQVMQAAQILAGFTLGGADLLRRAMAKAMTEELAQHRKNFVKEAQERNRIPATKANQLFDWLEHLSGYGFNKSHAIAYAMAAYQTAYLKANHPAEFLWAITQSDGDAELREN